MAGELNIEPILERIKRIHPSHKARLEPLIQELLTMFDKYLETHPHNEQNLLAFAEKLEKVREEAYHIYSELRSRTKYPSLYDRAVSLLRWQKLSKKVGKLPRMK